MKHIFVTSIVMAALATQAHADITVKVNPAVQDKEFPVEYGYISDLVKPRMERPEAMHMTGKVVDGQFTIKSLADGAAQYVIPTGERAYIMVYTMPGENLTVNLNSTSPLEYAVTGSRLMEDISRLDMESSKIEREFRRLTAEANADTIAAKKLSEDYDRIFTDYIAENKDAEAIPYAILHLDGQKFLDAYNTMTPAAKKSPIAPFLEPQKKYVERQIAAEKRKAELSSGTIDAPNFTFADMSGKSVSLSDFRGKWVIIDFWGSWCPWCIKGFPKLKEAYAKYKPNLEVVGVACNDPKEKWEAAVKKYELPWINLYNPEEGGGKLLEEYAVEGFPTKAIVNPEGKIVNITTGEDPAFFEILEKFMK